MNKENIYEIIDKLVIKYAANKTNELLGKNLIDDLEYDSISLMQLISELEENLDIEFEPDRMLESIDSYDSLVEYIMEMLNNDVQ